MYKPERSGVVSILPFQPPALDIPSVKEPEPETAEAVPEVSLEDEMEEAHRKIAEELEHAHNEASEIVKNANDEAEQILRDAHLQAEEIRERARSEGYSDGTRAADDELIRNLSEQTESLKRVLAEVDDANQRLYEDMENDIRGLIMAIVKKIINLAGENDDIIFGHLVKHAIEELRSENSLTIRVSPNDYERYFSSGSHTFALENGTKVTVSVTRDKTLSDWDCVIDDGDISVDAGLETQLRNIKLAFERAGDRVE